MDTILDPLLAILVIVVPLGMAYAILLFQSRKPVCDCRKIPARKISAITRDNLLQIGTELSRAEGKHAARRCHTGSLDLS